MPDFIDSAVLDKGECEVPRWLNTFWVTALSGQNQKINERVERQASCYAQDCIYSITKGQIKLILLGTRLMITSYVLGILSIAVQVSYYYFYVFRFILNVRYALNCRFL